MQYGWSTGSGFDLAWFSCLSSTSSASVSSVFVCGTAQVIFNFFRRTLVTMACAVRLSSVCRLSMTLLRVRRTRRGLNCPSLILHHGATRTVCIKVLEKIRWSSTSRRPCKLHWKGYENVAFFDQYLAFGNDTRYGHNYNGRRIGTRMQSIKRCHFQWP